MEGAPINFRLMLSGFFIGLGVYAALNQQWLVGGHLWRAGAGGLCFLQAVPALMPCQLLEE